MLNDGLPISDEYVEANQAEVDKGRYAYRDTLPDEEKTRFDQIEKIVENLNDIGSPYMLLSMSGENQDLFIRYFNLSSGKRIFSTKEESDIYYKRLYGAFATVANLYAIATGVHVIIDRPDAKYRRRFVNDTVIDEEKK